MTSSPDGKPARSVFTGGCCGRAFFRFVTKIPPRGQHVFLAGESRRRQLVMELANVTVVRRLFDKTELRTLRRFAKTGSIKNKRQCRCCCYANGDHPGGAVHILTEWPIGETL